MKIEKHFSAWRKTLLPTGATVALTLAAGLVHAQPIQVTSTGAAGITPSESDNDFLRIANAISGATAGETIILIGEFDLSEENAYSSYQDADRRINVNKSLTILGDGAAPTSVVRGPRTDASNTGFNVTASNVTLDNLIIEDFLTAVVAGNGAHGFTLVNSEINVGNFNYLVSWNATGLSLNPSGGTNRTIQDNVFRAYVNVNSTEPDENGDWPNLFGNIVPPTTILAVEGCCNATGQDGLLVDGNLFVLENHPDFPPYSTTTNIWGQGRVMPYYQNSHANESNQTYSNNHFDGTYVDPVTSELVPLMEGIRMTGRSGQFYEPERPHRIEWDANTFENTLFAYNPSFAWGATAPEDNMLITNHTFINAGSPAIRNADPSLYQSDPGSPVKVTFGLNNTVNGMTGIDMLHELHATGFFTPSPQGNDFGVTAVSIDPPADPGDILEDDAALFQPRFSDPFVGEANEGQYAVGYNIVPATEIDPGDPNIYAGQPDGTVIILTEDTQLAPGTRITSEVTIRGEASDKSHGGGVTISPTVPDFINAQFIIEGPDGHLTLENVRLTGEVDMFGVGSPRGVAFQGGGGLTTNHVIFEHYTGSAMLVSEDATTTVTETIFRNLNEGITTSHVTARVDVTESIFRDISVGVRTSRAEVLKATRNLFINAGGAFRFPQPPNDVIIGGAPGDGNLFFSPAAFFVDGGQGASQSFNYSYNWHFHIFGFGANETDGIITGNATARGFGPDVINGERLLIATQGGNVEWIETNVVAQFDRDGDGLPDVIELGSVGDYLLADTSGNGIPDGVHFALGVPVDFTGTPEIWTDDSLAEDSNDSGYADWYELALSVFAQTPFLGDVNNTGSVSLGDAIRALQFVNGAVDPADVANPNAINVVGGNVNSLANPLQILRYQAGVRTTFPALPGID